MHARRGAGFEVLEQDIPREMLYIADEVFLTGTAAEITPVRSVDQHSRSAKASAARSPSSCRSRSSACSTARRRTRWGWLEPIVRRSGSRAGSDRGPIARLKEPFMRRMPKTLFEKVWEPHDVVPETADTPAVLYIDLHLIHEVTTPQAFDAAARAGPAGAPPGSHPRDAGSLHADGARTRCSDLVSISRVRGREAGAGRWSRTAREFGIELLGLGSTQRGIVHVIGPELGATQPGKTIVCGDSHTSTHGAFGALAFGIGTTEVGHVLATQCLLQRKPKTLAINVERQAAAPASPRRT